MSEGVNGSGGVAAELRDVVLAFDDHTVLDDVSLKLFEGETLSVLGGSGAGKSTILRLVLGLLAPTAGEILVNGRDIGRASNAEVLAMRKEMGMVFQGAALFDSLSVDENVAFALREDGGFSEAEIDVRVREALEFVDLDAERVGPLLPAELSGGMQKRVGVARAIVDRPAMLLYDEPTSGLDPITTRTINELIRKLQTGLGVSSIVVTHDIKSAFRISHRVALLSAGKIVFIGTPEEMTASEHEYVGEFLR